MKSYKYIIFLALISLISLTIGMSSTLYEGQSVIKDDGVTYIVDGDYSQDANGSITKRNANGTINTTDFSNIADNKNVVLNTNKQITTNDADGDTQYNGDDKGNVTKNEDWNADTAFPEYNNSASLSLSDGSSSQGKNMFVRGKDGKLMEVPWTGSKTGINYNEPGYFRYQPSTFVPNYEDSVYLSRLTGLSTTKPIEDTASKKGGFCEYHKHSSIKIEQECGKLEKDSCASTSCCVLLGGSRCVGGNEKGPTMKANYGDITILNKDHYFYQGKCYGNCPR